jgi:hypothetical protein
VCGDLQGKFQFDLWGLDASKLSGMWDWEGLRQKVGGIYIGVHSKVIVERSTFVEEGLSLIMSICVTAGDAIRCAQLAAACAHAHGLHRPDPRYATSETATV